MKINKENSRTRNAIRNVLSGILNKSILLLFPFLIRSILIKTLGAEYLGLSSLFTSILQVLNLAELGFGSAIIFSLYKPISVGDKVTISALLNLYKKIYRIIGILVFFTGLIILPFLKYLINGGYPQDINIYILYILYLTNSSVSYFLFAYKSSLLIAHQRTDITSNVMSIISVLQYLVQIIVLYIFKNYYLFVIVMIIFTILNNITSSIIVDYKYPDYKCYGDVPPEIKEQIKTKVTGLMIDKVCQTSRNSLDSIFISYFLGLNLVAVYNNYYTIFNAVVGLMAIFSSSILPGIGNSIVEESVKKNYLDMNKFNFIYMWISGIATVMLLCLYQPFMKLWMGEKMLLKFSSVILISLYFYILKMGDIRGTYSDAIGLWWENRYRAIGETLTNIVLNYLLGKMFGINGIILATLISLFTINFMYGSSILFKKYFGSKRFLKYLSSQLRYFLATSIAAFLSFSICELVPLNGLYEIVVRFIVSFFITNVVYILLYNKTKNYLNAQSFILKLLGRDI